MEDGQDVEPHPENPWSQIKALRFYTKQAGLTTHGLFECVEQDLTGLRDQGTFCKKLRCCMVKDFEGGRATACMCTRINTETHLPRWTKSLFNGNPQVNFLKRGLHVFRELRIDVALKNKAVQVLGNFNQNIESWRPISQSPVICMLMSELLATDSTVLFKGWIMNRLIKKGIAHINTTLHLALICTTSCCAKCCEDLFACSDSLNCRPDHIASCIIFANGLRQKHLVQVTLMPWKAVS